MVDFSECTPVLPVNSIILAGEWGSGGNVRLSVYISSEDESEHRGTYT